MKCYYVLFVLFLVEVVSSSIHTSQANHEVQHKFDEFQVKYNKKYTAEEYDTRFQNFKDSIERSKELNLKSTNAVYGITKFSDMSTDEFKNTILMKDKIAPKEIKPEELVSSNKIKSVPEIFDWRDKGAVTPVKNQEQCGSCWAFSATENIESMWILAGKANDSIAFSPQQIVDCDEWQFGCGGGNPYSAFNYVIEYGGIESEKDYPYTGEGGSCQFNKNEIEGSIKSYQYATEWYNETMLQQSLLNMGPLSICVFAELWQDYLEGVMTWTECAYFGGLDHCVQLVGFNTTNTDMPFWYVRNSWGTDWGVDGYIWLQMWEDTCGLTHEATCAIV